MTDITVFMTAHKCIQKIVYYKETNLQRFYFTGFLRDKIFEVKTKKLTIRNGGHRSDKVGNRKSCAVDLLTQVFLYVLEGGRVVVEETVCRLFHKLADFILAQLFADFFSLTSMENKYDIRVTLLVYIVQHCQTQSNYFVKLW